MKWHRRVGDTPLCVSAESYENFSVFLALLRCLLRLRRFRGEAAVEMENDAGESRYYLNIIRENAVRVRIGSDGSYQLSASQLVFSHITNDVKNMYTFAKRNDTHKTARKNKNRKTAIDESECKVNEENCNSSEKDASRRINTQRCEIYDDGGVDDV